MRKEEESKEEGGRLGRRRKEGVWGMGGGEGGRGGRRKGEGKGEG